MRDGRLSGSGGKDIVNNVDECVKVVEEAIWDIKLQQQEDGYMVI